MEYRKINYLDKQGKNWNFYIMETLELGGDVYYLGFYKENPYDISHNFEYGDEFCIFSYKLNGKVLDYTADFSWREYPKLLIGTVINSFDGRLYDYIIDAIITKTNCSNTGDETLKWDQQKEKWLFYLAWDKNYQAELKQNEGLQLFYAFFNTFKKYIDSYHADFISEDWYKRFLIALEKLNKKEG